MECSVRIANSQSVNSIEFRDNHMTVWHYYQIRSGKRVEYNEVVEFVSGGGGHQSICITEQRGHFYIFFVVVSCVVA